ncbi:MAG: hypothetical protein A3E87_05430 [Gammaproteobacteria bacterium RIFCSPHIGHO2_12_FULL_35_23]|nr:MAG: hypothetical protein A3E87_05430 [Gammaproteobacteria bacterium RIFCSPHIGHO2_12_FULL_35_23]
MQNLVNETKVLLNLSLPLIALLLAQKFLQIISTYMMGHIGAQALAAGALVSSIYLIFIIIGIGTLNAVGILIAQAYGENNKEIVNLYLYHGLYASLLLSLPFLIIIYFAPALYSLFYQNSVLIKLSAQLLHALMWGFPALLGFAALREFVSALNYQWTIMVISFFAIPFNLVLFYIVYHTSLFSIAWIGYINAITEWGMFIILLIYINKNKMLKNYTHLPSVTKLQKSIFKIIFRIGIPSGLTSSLEVIMSTTIVIMMGYFGIISLAAHQIAFQCVTFAYMVPLGIGLAIGLRVSKKGGLHQHSQALALSVYSALGIEAIFSFLVIVIFILFPITLTNLFIHPYQSGYLLVVQTTKKFLLIAAFFHCFDALQGIIMGILRGLRDTFIPMFIALFSFLVVALGGGYFLAFILKLQGVGLWLGLAAGLAISSLFLSLRLYKHYVKIKRIPNNTMVEVIPN